MTPSLITWIALALAAVPGAAPEPTDTPDTPAELRQAARDAFRQADNGLARRHLQALRRYYEERRAGEDGSVERFAWSQRLAEVAHEFLRGGQLDEALSLMGEVADLDQPVAGPRDDLVASTAASLYRRLAQLDAEERFDRLSAWTLPTETRRSLRVLTAVTPVEAPPSIFGRAIRERPRRDTFAVAETGGLRGLFCSAWELVTAAEQTGRLRRLEAEIAGLEQQGIPRAAFVRHLIAIVADEPDDAQRDEVLGDILRSWPASEESPSEARLVLAAACLAREAWQPVGEALLGLEIESPRATVSPWKRPFLKYAFAVAIARRDHEEPFEPWDAARPALWIPAGLPASTHRDRGGVPPIWLTHEDQLLHWTGDGNDFLFFRYPLTGDFEFTGQSHLGGSGLIGGSAAYGGRSIEIAASQWLLRLMDIHRNQLTQLPCPFVDSSALVPFYTFSLRAADGEVRFACNQHPVWAERREGPGSPWIGLRAAADSTPVFRKLTIKGEPTIPREVRLLGRATHLEWSARAYRERTSLETRQAPSIEAIFGGVAGRHDWSLGEGTLEGHRLGRPEDGVAQSVLHYLRPLQSGESIAYEFFYAPGEFAVHPALGRLAFLVEPEGVRLHWMTDPGQEWTGLDPENAVIEPLNRRGPRPLPLAAGGWNRVTLLLDGDTMTIALNDTTIYTRKMEPGGGRAFGFYHDKNRSAARVRNIVMRGDWPEQWSDADRRRLLAPRDRPSKAERRFAGAIFADRHVHGSVLDVRTRSAAMAPEARYAFLSDWVLPGDDHATLRMALDFSPSYPVPPLADGAALATESRLAPRPSREQEAWQGGLLVAPAVDLVVVARQLGRLDSLDQRVAAYKPASAGQQRSKLTMLALIAMARGEFERANALLAPLAERVVSGKQMSFSEQWPETLAIWQAAQFPETGEVAREMVFAIRERQVRAGLDSGYTAWERHVRALASRLGFEDFRARRRAAGQEEIVSRRPSSRNNWFPARLATAETRGRGYPPERWEWFSPSRIENVDSHHDDWLFYRVPLRGDFEVEGDLSGFGWREASLWVAGQWVSPVYTHRHYETGNVRTAERFALEERLLKTDPWIRYRAAVRDGVCTVWFNGRKVCERPLAKDHDPWIAVRTPYTTNGGARKLRISGRPEIPGSVAMATDPELAAWLSVMPGHLVGPDQAWQPRVDLPGGGILGSRRLDLPGSHWESLLRYHRPMAEDGSIEYEFFYREGASHVHPALDRLVFLLEPDGVRLHWLTNGPFERSGLAPDNLHDEPQHRRGGDRLPLNADAWNRLRLTLAGDTVQLVLNDQLVYEHPLHASNARSFGLFHYRDRTEALVRNLVWRGEWPRQLPSTAEQQLAGEGAEFLDASLEKLTARFHHDFTKQESIWGRFGLFGGEVSHCEAVPAGLRVTRPGGPLYHSTILSPKLTAEGDFDIVATFEHFDPHPSQGGSSNIFMRTLLGEQGGHECLLYRRRIWHRVEPMPIVQASYVTNKDEGARRDRLPYWMVEADTGRLRMARRGDTVYYLFAENDSPVFRLLGTRTATRDPVKLGGAQLVVQTHGEGQTRVVWKDLTIRAEKLSGVAMLDHDRLRDDLDKQRANLAQGYAHDFSREPLSDEQFNTWGVIAPRRETDGLRITAQGSDTWQSAGLGSQVGLRGDFDVQVSFAPPALAMPKETDNSACYLQVSLPDGRETQVNVILVLQSDGRTDVCAQIKSDGENGRSVYNRLNTTPVETIESMRIARRGKRMFFLYRTPGAARDRVMAQFEVSDLPIPPGAVRIFLHAGGEGRQSAALLKHYRAAADKLTFLAAP